MPYKVLEPQLIVKRMRSGNIKSGRYEFHFGDPSKEQYKPTQSFMNKNSETNEKQGGVKPQGGRKNAFSTEQ